MCRALYSQKISFHQRLHLFALSIHEGKEEMPSAISFLGTNKVCKLLLVMNYGTGFSLKRSIQSVEISYFVHATEDRATITNSLSRILTGAVQPEEERMVGHFGNTIIHVRYHLSGEEGVGAVARIASLLSKDSKDKIMTELNHLIDEHNALYLRFDKQFLVSGRLEMGTEDPIRVKVKPRGFVLREDRLGFYKSILGWGR